MAINSSGFKSFSSEANNLIKGIPTTQDLINNLYDKYFVVKDNSGIGGFVFSLLNDVTITANNDISENYLEDGSIVSDHIVSLPRKIELRGFMAEETFKVNALTKIAEAISSKLAIVGNYAPNLTSGAQQAFNKAYASAQQTLNYIDGAINSAKSLFSFLDSISPAETIQGKAYLALETARTSRKLTSDDLFTIETKIQSSKPFTGVLNNVNRNNNLAIPNMAIESIKWIVNVAETGQTLSDISVTLKEIRFATTKKSTIKQKSLGKTAGQKSAVKTNNNMQGATTEKNVSFLKRTLG